MEHEQEREKIVKAAYKKIKKKFNFEKILNNFIAKTNTNASHNNIPKYDCQVLNLKESYMRLSKKKLFQILKPYEYVSFQKGKSMHWYQTTGG